MEPMKVEPVVLEGRAVRVVPLSVEHAEGLLSVCEPDIFKYFGHFPNPWTLEGFRAYIQGLLNMPDMQPFATTLRETGQPVGVTTYMDIRPAHRGMEIGNTWIARHVQGTAVNPECKYLLLRHGFETLGAIRIQLKTDGRNLQSQHAIAKLGAKYEGTLRKFIIMPDGFLRDNVMFSIVAEEWPTVKAGLEARLGYVP
ncbi:MAG TPA: GNAT family protein [Chloroflexia bacterium]|nr:GNAT family protein [Chloroflexia bacterium]